MPFFFWIKKSQSPSLDWIHKLQTQSYSHSADWNRWIQLIHPLFLKWVPVDRTVWMHTRVDWSNSFCRPSARSVIEENKLRLCSKWIRNLLDHTSYSVSSGWVARGALFELAGQDGLNTMCISTPCLCHWLYAWFVRGITCTPKESSSCHGFSLSLVFHIPKRNKRKQMILFPLTHMAVHISQWGCCQARIRGFKQRDCIESLAWLDPVFHFQQDHSLLFVRVFFFSFFSLLLFIRH